MNHRLLSFDEFRSQVSTEAHSANTTSSEEPVKLDTEDIFTTPEGAFYTGLIVFGVLAVFAMNRLINGKAGQEPDNN